MSASTLPCRSCGAAAWPVACVAVVASLGCGGGEPSGGASELDRMAAALEEKAQADETAAGEQAVAATVAEAERLRAEAERLANEAPSPITDDDYVRGSKLKRNDLLQTPIRAGIRAEQDIKSTAVEHALNLYWGEHGEYPQSHDEFIEKIVEFNGIQLEELKDPYEPWYDAESHTLMKRVKPEAIEQARAAADAAEGANG